jgi:hypothetical protein
MLTPISWKVFFPAFGSAASSFGPGALAVLGTGSLASTSVQLPGAASLRQPTTAIVSSFSTFAAGAWRATTSAGASSVSERQAAIGFMIRPV